MSNNNVQPFPGSSFPVGFNAQNFAQFQKTMTMGVNWKQLSKMSPISFPCIAPMKNVSLPVFNPLKNSNGQFVFPIRFPVENMKKLASRTLFPAPVMNPALNVAFKNVVSGVIPNGFLFNSAPSAPSRLQPHDNIEEMKKSIETTMPGKVAKGVYQGAQAAGEAAYVGGRLAKESFDKAAVENPAIAKAGIKTGVSASVQTAIFPLWSLVYNNIAFNMSTSESFKQVIANGPYNGAGQAFKGAINKNFGTFATMEAVQSALMASGLVSEDNAVIASRIAAAAGAAISVTPTDINKILQKELEREAQKVLPNGTPQQIQEYVRSQLAEVQKLLTMRDKFTGVTPAIARETMKLAVGLSLGDKMYSVMKERYSKDGEDLGLEQELPVKVLGWTIANAACAPFFNVAREMQRDLVSVSSRSIVQVGKDLGVKGLCRGAVSSLPLIILSGGAMILAQKVGNSYLEDTKERLQEESRIEVLD